MSDYEFTVEDVETGHIIEVQYDRDTRTQFRSIYSPDGRLLKRHVSKTRINPIPIMKHDLIRNNFRLDIDF